MTTSYKTSRLITRWRIPLGFLVVTILIIENLMVGVQPNSLFSLFESPTSLAGSFGLIVVLAGVGLRAWAAGTIMKAKEVSCTGPYALSRHPLYVGSFLIAVGFCIIMGNNLINILAVFAFALLIYLPKMIVEEREMRDQFGSAYDDYRAQTSAFIPLKIPKSIFGASYGLGTSQRLGTWNRNQYLKHREYRAGAVAIIVMLIIQGYIEYLRRKA